MGPGSAASKPRPRGVNDAAGGAATRGAPVRFGVPAQEPEGLSDVLRSVGTARVAMLAKQQSDLDALTSKVVWSREYAVSRLEWKRRQPLLVLALRAWRPRFADAPSGPAHDASARRRSLADRPAGARA